jgi:hypothetical protein
MAKSVVLLSLALHAAASAQVNINFEDKVLPMEVKTCDLGPQPDKGWVFSASAPGASFKAAVRNRLKSDGTLYQMVRVTEFTGGSSLVNWVASRYQHPGGRWTESYKPDSPEAEGPLFEITGNSIRIDHDVSDAKTGETRHVSFLVNCAGGGEADNGQGGSETAGAGGAPGGTAGVEGQEFWQASIDGHHQGPIAIANIRTGRLENLMLYSAPGAPELITISIDHPEKNGSFASGSTTQADTEVVFLKGASLYSGIRKGFMSGQRGGSDTPEPPLLSLGDFNSATVAGSVTGVLWRSQPAPGDPRETSSVNIEFTARACYGQHPDYSRCMDPKEPWP